MNKKQKIWERDDYYRIANKASLDLSHPGLQLVKKEAGKARKVLEVGCGEGTKLTNLVSENNQAYGVDISTKAVKLAKKQYPNIQFRIADAENLPFPKASFDLVFSAFMLEHTINPKKVVDEMIRVAKPGGKIIILAPNYGAPNRASPCFKGSRIVKLLFGFVKDLVSVGFSQKKLNWNKVRPLTDKGEYEIDWDTSVEPYLRSLKDYMSEKKLKICQATSYWQEIKENLNFIQTIFKFLGRLGIYPFVYCGPHMLVLAEKKDEE